MTEQQQLEFISTKIVKGYDIHVYFFANNRTSHESAKRLMNAAQQLWPELPMKMFDAPVGPHPMPMFQIEIDQMDPLFTQVISWIMLNHGSHSVLLHPHTGNELRDHTLHPFWLGTPVPLDISKLK